MPENQPSITLKRDAPIVSREAALLLACAQSALNQTKPENIHVLLNTELDWKQLLRLASEQGLLPLLHRTLQSLPATALPQSVSDRLRLHYCSTALLNFYLAQELIQLVSLLRAHQIPALPYKGPVLAVSAYGSLALRQFQDLDVLVDQSDYDRSKAVLLSEGFQGREDYGWESHFISPTGGYCLDLHQGLTPRMFPYPIEFAKLWERRCETTVCGEQIPCLSGEDSILVLCMQVAKDSWAKQPKLAKLCDIARFLHRHPNLDWERIHGEANRIGARGTLSFAFALAHEILGTAYPSGLFKTPRTNRRTRSLVTQTRTRVLAQLSHHGSDSSQQAGLSEQARFHAQLRERLRDRVPYRLEPLRLCFETLFRPNARDRSLVSLPKGLHCLYSLIRPFRLAYEYLLSPLIHQPRLSRWAAHQSDRAHHLEGN